MIVGVRQAVRLAQPRASIAQVGRRRWVPLQRSRIRSGEGEHRCALELADEVQRLVATGPELVPRVLQHVGEVEVLARLAVHLLGGDVGELLLGDEVGAGQRRPRRRPRRRRRSRHPTSATPTRRTSRPAGSARGRRRAGSGRARRGRCGSRPRADRRAGSTGSGRGTGCCRSSRTRPARPPLSLRAAATGMPGRHLPAPPARPRVDEEGGRPDVGPQQARAPDRGRARRGRSAAPVRGSTTWAPRAAAPEVASPPMRSGDGGRDDAGRRGSSIPTRQVLGDGSRPAPARRSPPALTHHEIPGTCRRCSAARSTAQPLTRPVGSWSPAPSKRGAEQPAACVARPRRRARSTSASHGWAWRGSSSPRRSRIRSLSGAPGAEHRVDPVQHAPRPGRPRSRPRAARPRRARGPRPAVPMTCSTKARRGAPAAGRPGRAQSAESTESSRRSQVGLVDRGLQRREVALGGDGGPGDHVDVGALLLRPPPG